MRQVAPEAAALRTGASLQSSRLKEAALSCNRAAALLAGQTLTRNYLPRRLRTTTDTRALCQWTPPACRSARAP